MSLQTILVAVIVILSILLVIVGIQVFLIVLDLRRAVKKLNTILEDAVIGGGLISPDKLTGITQLIKKGRTRDTQDQGQA